MLRAVDKHGITPDSSPDFIVGTSAGALNGALIASPPQTVATTDAFGRIWRDLRRAQVLPLNPVTACSASSAPATTSAPNPGCAV
jgi:predicted acylesterase/phospholipase RssA